MSLRLEFEYCSSALIWEEYKYLEPKDEKLFQIVTQEFCAANC